LIKTILLKGLYLKNFKGIKELDIDFSKVTNIFGENATGKTSVFDAFTWILFDKDSQDRSKFNVQPLDANNDIIHMLETEVSAAVEIDGIKTVLKKVLKEKWVKKRGEVEAELKGTETSYYVDEVPFKQGEYQKKIADITGDESIFKLLTNPLYFSSVLKWQDRRKIIFDINGDVDIHDVINYNQNLSELLNCLNPNEDMESMTKRVKAQKAKLKKDKESIPARVDELNRAIRSDIDFESIESKKNQIAAEIKNVDEQLLDKSKTNDVLLKEKDNLYKLKDKLRGIEYNARVESEKPIREFKEQIYKINDRQVETNTQIDRVESTISSKKAMIENFNKIMKGLRIDYTSIRGQEITFDKNMFICPTCKRPFETENIEAQKQQLIENFNSDKAKKLKKINIDGRSKKEKVQILDKEIQELTEKLAILNDESLETASELEKVEEQYRNFKPQLNLESNTEYQELKSQIDQLETKLSQPVESNSQSIILKNQKLELQAQLERLNSSLAYREQNKQHKSRIKELQDEEKRQAQLIADLEKQEYLSEQFIKTKVELLESSINSKFSYVKFKLFETQVNGGLNETCEALVNGVPFSNANTASQINAGIDIINALSEFYGINAPIFIDNRESINQIIHSNSQIINLIVSQDKKLRIESEEI
jgi:DNA repair exonuclease SbcCD ATPase subunit